MTENNQKWLDILKAADIEITKDYQNGRILGVFADRDGEYWRLDIQLERPLPCKILMTLIQKIDNYLKSVAPIKQVRFQWSYDELPLDTPMIEEYYQTAIRLGSNVRKITSALLSYSKEIMNENFNIYVAEEEDERIANDALTIIKTYFDSWGLKQYQFGVFISQFEVSTKEQLENERKIREQRFNDQDYELQKQALLRAQSQIVVKEQKQRKTFNNALRVKISDLPKNAIEVEEFIQKHGTNIVILEGEIIKAEIRPAGTYRLFQGILCDGYDSIFFKQFLNDKNQAFFEKEVKTGIKVNLRGVVGYDNYIHDVSISCRDIEIKFNDAKNEHVDEAKSKRIELHAHSKMSTLDSVMDIEKYVQTAVAYGHQAIAITDHANCHVLPDLFREAKAAGIKPIAGVEGNYIDDSRYNITLTTGDYDLNSSEFTIFDIETTGFSVNFHEIIEIGAVKIKGGIVIDQFSTFVRPTRLLSEVITKLTNITNEDVVNAPLLDEVLPKFISFVGDSILVAHNATFDTSHIYHQMRRLGLYQHDFPCIDTLQLARILYSDSIKHFRLEAVAKFLKVEQDVQHRAIADARTTTNIFMRMLGDLSNLHIDNYNQINSIIDENEVFKYVIPNHICLLVRNKVGLKNLYKIISDSHTTHFHKEARMLKSVINQYREGILVGSGCANGEIFKTAFEKSYDELLAKVGFYDYLEVQPPECYYHLVQLSGEEITKEHIVETIKRIYRAGKEKGIPVVATGDVHQIDAADSSLRQIFVGIPRPGGGLHELANPSIKEIPPMYYRSTNDMIKAFEPIFGDLDAYEIVVRNTNYINDMIEEYDLFPRKLFTPRDDFLSDHGVPSMSKKVEEMSYQNARKMYGDNLPACIETRLQQELQTIISNGYSSIYYVSYLLVKNSVDHGYVVGSRGSVGSSFVATVMSITEVNPLKPHYLCPKCHFSAFKDDEVMLNSSDVPTVIKENLQVVETGLDLPKMTCPRCQTMMKSDGVDIPFETFLGFKGEKVPDIDLNFSGDYQERAHEFCRSLFGPENSFRAGTIGTVAEKTAFGFVRKYLETSGKNLRDAEIQRIAANLIGAKRTTGQHPGGIVVVPDDIEYTDIFPVHYPADDATSTWRTTHFDYHSFERNLLKMDILGHDDPTVIYHLMGFVHDEPEKYPFSTLEEIPLTDSAVLSLFRTKEALNLKGEDDDPLLSGTIGIPEFGTVTARDMLKDIMPETFADIIKISGLAHGRGIWQGNERELLMDDKNAVTFKELIGCRDDIMTYLLDKNLEPADAFRIMEGVRKGHGIISNDERIMEEHHVPAWYINSCEQIKYMFPKAHATAYVIMALRIGWFKVYRPIQYYAAYFSRRASTFDVEVLANGKNAIRNKIQELKQKIATRQATNKEIDLVDELQIALEMTLRGFSFRQVDLNKSDGRFFTIAPDQMSLYIPFRAVDALGDAAAASIVEARNMAPFTSQKDVERRTKLNKTTFLKLKILGAMDELPEGENETLFG